MKEIKKKEERLATQQENEFKNKSRKPTTKRKINQIEVEPENTQALVETEFGCGRFCYACNEEFGLNSNSLKWLPCEGRGCNNWCCGCETNLLYTCQNC